MFLGKTVKLIVFWVFKNYVIGIEKLKLAEFLMKFALLFPTIFKVDWVPKIFQLWRNI